MFDEKMIFDFLNNLDVINMGDGLFHSIPSDVYEKDNVITIEMDMPGYKKEDVKLEYDKDVLTVKVEKSADEDKEEKEPVKYFVRERALRFKMIRKFRIEGIDEESINASLKDGILVITMKKLDKTQNKKTIEIK